jgi:HEAT repeats
MFDLDFHGWVLLGGVIWLGLRLLLLFWDVAWACARRAEPPRRFFGYSLLTSMLLGSVSGGWAVAAALRLLLSGPVPGPGSTLPWVMDPRVLGGLALFGLGYVGGFFGGAFLDLLLYRLELPIAKTLLALRLWAYVRQMQATDRGVRAWAARTLSFIGPRAVAAVPQLRGGLRDSDPEVRAFAALALITNRANDPDTAAAVRQTLQDPEGRVRTAAACALVAWKAAPPEAVLPDLIAGLEDAADWVPGIAAHYLGQVGAAAAPAIPALRRAAADPDTPNWMAFDALSRIGEASVPALETLLQHRSAAVRRASVSALQRMGTKAAAAVPALREALSDRDEEVRRQAAKALQVITARKLK